MAAQAAIHASFSKRLSEGGASARLRSLPTASEPLPETCVDGRRHGGAVLRPDAAMTG